MAYRGIKSRRPSQRKHKVERRKADEGHVNAIWVLKFAATLFLAISLLFRRFLLGLGQPSQEWLGSLANLFGSSQVHILLARLGTPLCDNLLADEVVVVVELQDLDNLGVKLGVFLAILTDESLRASEESLLMTLRADDLHYCG